MDRRPPPPPQYSRPPDSGPVEPPQDRPSMAPPKPAGESHANTTPIYQPPQPPPPPQSSASGSAKPQQPAQMPFADPFRSRQAHPFMPNQQQHHAQHQHAQQQQQHRRGSYGYHGSGSGRDNTAGAQQSRDGAPSSSWPGSPSNAPFSHPPGNSGSPSAMPPDPARHTSMGPQSPPKYYGPGAPESQTTYAGRQMLPPSPSQQQPGAGYNPQRPPPYAGRDSAAMGQGHRPSSGMSISSMLGDAPSQPPPPGASSQSPSGTPQRRALSPRRAHSNPTRLDPPWGRPETPETHGALRNPDAQNYPPTSSPRYLPKTLRDSPEYIRAGSAGYYPPPRSMHSNQRSPTDRQESRSIEEKFPSRPSSQPVPYGLRDTRGSNNGTGPAPSYGSKGPDDVRTHSPYAERGGGYAGPGERPSSAQPLLHSYGRPPSRPQDEGNMLRRNIPGQESIREEGRREHDGPRGRYLGPNQSPSLAPEAPRSHPHASDLFRRGPDGVNTPEPHLLFSRPPLEVDRRRERSAGGEPRTSLHDGSSRRASGEEMQRSRSFLGMGSESYRRGRASPLPQAVKGAQAQPAGPGGGDPGVKSEFGRIFQGLGSGLGGAGSLTPSRQSPAPQMMRDGVSGDGEGPKMMRVSSLGPRLGRRARDEDGRDVEDGRLTPLGSGGRKKPRMLGLYPDDDAPDTPASDHSPLRLRRSGLAITSKNVVVSVAGKTRNHLGSTLYDVEIKPSPFESTPLNDRWGYYKQYKPSRRFSDEDDNCTISVRVPREFLTDESREKLCVDRYLYGTEVFTDDSDPVVAAIHSGWIRGAWGPDVDINLLDLPPPPPEGVPVPRATTELPRTPMPPPKNMDAHIEILILPPLVGYAPSLRFGVKSREWGGNHDGRSFMVVGVRWVDEGRDRHMERVGRARKLRPGADWAEKSSLLKAARDKRKRTTRMGDMEPAGMPVETLG